MCIISRDWLAITDLLNYGNKSTCPEKQFLLHHFTRWKRDPVEFISKPLAWTREDLYLYNFLKVTLELKWVPVN